MVPGKDTIKQDFGEGLLLEEVADVEECPAGCGECIVLSGVLADIEDKMAQKLAATRARTPRAVRFLLRGVHIDEILLRFPQLTKEDVKGWRNGKGEVSEDVIAWAHTVAPTGRITDCRCGHCPAPKPQLPSSP
jgi:hypothetical protein